MKPARPLAVSLLSLALFALPPLLAQKPPNPAPAPPVSRAAADKHYAEKSYALALPEYQSLLKQLPPTAPSRTLIEYRIAVALGASQKWDEALAAWDTFLAAHAQFPALDGARPLSARPAAQSGSASGLQSRDADLSRQ